MIGPDLQDVSTWTLFLWLFYTCCRTLTSIWLLIMEVTEIIHMISYCIIRCSLANSPWKILAKIQTTSPQKHLRHFPLLKACHGQNFPSYPENFGPNSEHATFAASETNIFLHWRNVTAQILYHAFISRGFKLDINMTKMDTFYLVWFYYKLHPSWLAYLTQMHSVRPIYLTLCKFHAK